jgi:AcrR family transcriptional regulator
LKKVDKKQDILDAAMQCLARYGIVKSTMDDIAQVMGLKKASLYYYYKNKESIFLDALAREAERFHRLADERADTQASAADKLTTILTFYYEYFRDRAEWLELDAQAAADNHLLLRTIYKNSCQENRSLFAEYIQQGIDRGEFRPLDAAHVARVLHLSVQSQHLETIRQAAENKEKLDYDKLQQDSLFILELFLNGIKRS